MSELYRKISAAVDRRRDDIIGLVQELVRIPTFTPPGHNYDTAVEALVPKLTSIGFEVQRIDMPDEVFQQRCRVHYPEMNGVRANLLAKKDFGKPERVLWYAHVDTVPVPDADKWTRDPFGAQVVGDRMYGRGTADAKGECCAAIAAFQILHELGIEPRYNVTIALTGDEEIGPYSGLMYLADEGHFADCSYFHSLDGSGDGVIVAHNGALTWRIDIKGVSTHTGRAYSGINPIEHSLAILEEFRALQTEVLSRRSDFPIPPNIAADTGVDKLQPTFNVTMAHGGVKHTIVPPTFVLQGDRRFLPEEPEEDVIAEIRAAFERAKAKDPLLDAEIAFRPFYMSHAGDPNHPWAKEVHRIVEAVVGEPRPITASGGSSDVAYCSHVTGIPVVGFGIGRYKESMNHGIDENIRIGDLLDLVKITAAVATGAL
ncbi:MAG: M20/M25/M40 family metallo-hydrolase [Chloroflexi bacterium]|nr:M20/M25/M40 family metallo-hydrolase [Chloroflexota bacterium]